MANEGLMVTGAVLLVIGIVLLFIPFVCVIGIVLAIVGFALLIAGAVQEPAPTFYYPPPVVYPAAVPQAPGASTNPACPRCGQPLEYVYQYQRWYCRAENVYPWG